MSIYDHLDVPDLLIHFFLLPLVVDIETLSNSQPIVTYFLTFDPYSTNIWSPVVILSLHVTVYFIPDVRSDLQYWFNNVQGMNPYRLYYHTLMTTNRLLALHSK